jgi:O-antigen/teichoic acid export membrane protein/SAM-dependent methyltransferase
MRAAALALGKAVGGTRGARFRRRALAVATFSLNNLLLPFLTPIASLLVVRLASVELWGEFVGVMVVVQLGTHVVAWGNKDYLLREFSRNPAAIAHTWQTSLVTRLALLAALSPIVFALGFPVPRGALMLAWGLGIVLDQAFDVVVLYRKDFAYSLAVDLGGLLALVGAILVWGAHVGLDGLLALWAMANLAQSVALGLRYRSLWQDWSGRFAVRYFRRASIFFGLGLSGLLQSRIDLYSVNAFLPRREVGQYQVVINLVLYAQSVAGFVLTPFVKELYRLNGATIARLAVRLSALGMALLGPMLLAAYAVVTHLYAFDVSPLFWLIAIPLVLPIYAYLPIIYALFKADRQSTVLKVNLLGTAANLACNLVLMPRWGLPGAAVASAAAQLVTLAAYLSQMPSFPSESVSPSRRGRRIQHDSSNLTVVTPSAARGLGPAGRRPWHCRCAAAQGQVFLAAQGAARNDKTWEESYPRLLCPNCRQPVDADSLACAGGHRFVEDDSVLALLSDDFAAHLRSYLPAHAAFRSALGRRILDPAIYPGLPGAAAADNFEWRLRVYDLSALERELRGSQRILEVGAYNGWLSHRLTAWGHIVTAVDTFVDEHDGLRAKKFYPLTWRSIQMDLNDLSLIDETFDAVILNRCLHFFPDPIQYVADALRRVAPGGRLVATGLQSYRDPRARIREVAAIRSRLGEFGIDFLHPTRAYLDFADRRRLQDLGMTLRAYPQLWRANLKSRLWPKLPRHEFGVVRAFGNCSDTLPDDESSG